MLVLLDRDDGRYTAGDTVRGRVHIVLTQDVSVKGQPTIDTHHNQHNVLELRLILCTVAHCATRQRLCDAHGL